MSRPSWVGTSEATVTSSRVGRADHGGRARDRRSAGAPSARRCATAAAGTASAPGAITEQRRRIQRWPSMFAARERDGLGHAGRAARVHAAAPNPSPADLPAVARSVASITCPAPASRQLPARAGRPARPRRPPSRHACRATRSRARAAARAPRAARVIRTARRALGQLVVGQRAPRSRRRRIRALSQAHAETSYGHPP